MSGFRSTQDTFRRLLLLGLLGYTLSACGLASIYTRHGGAVAHVAVHEVAWNSARTPIGHVRTVADAGDVVCVFADDGATVLVSQAAIATDRSVSQWKGAMVPAAKNGAPQIFGLDEKGRVLALRAQRSFEDVSEHFGLSAKSIHASAVLNTGSLVFASESEVFIADGERVSTFNAPPLSEVSAATSGFIGITKNGIYAYDLTGHSARTFALPGVTHAVVGTDGRIVATTKHALYVADADGTLSLVYAAEGDVLHGLTASGDSVWFGDGEQLGLVRNGQVQETTGIHIPIDAELAPSPRGDVWVIGPRTLTRFAMNNPSVALSAPPTGSTQPTKPVQNTSDLWRESLSAVFARSCANCHLRGRVSGVDLSTADRWQTERNDIYTRVVVQKDMPPPGHVLSDADRETIRAFGAKN